MVKCEILIWIAALHVTETPAIIWHEGNWCRVERRRQFSKLMCPDIRKTLMPISVRMWHLVQQMHNTWNRSVRSIWQVKSSCLNASATQYDLISMSGGSEVEEMHLRCFSVVVVVAASSKSIILQFLKVNAIGNDVDQSSKSGQICLGPF